MISLDAATVLSDTRRHFQQQGKALEVLLDGEHVFTLLALVKDCTTSWLSTGQWHAANVVNRKPRALAPG